MSTQPAPLPPAEQQQADRASRSYKRLQYIEEVGGGAVCVFELGVCAWAEMRSCQPLQLVQAELAATRVHSRPLQSVIQAIDIAAAVMQQLAAHTPDQAVLRGLCEQFLHTAQVGRTPSACLPGACRALTHYVSRLNGSIRPTRGAAGC